MNILWLSENDVARLITIKDALPVVQEAFESLSRKKAQMPPKIYLDFEEFRGDLRAMPGYLRQVTGAGKKPFAAVKVVNSHPHNPEKGLPTVMAILVLNDPSTGRPLALMAGGALTNLRTGAAGGVAAQALARSDARTVGLVGCGRQAATQLAALYPHFLIQQVLVAGGTKEEAQGFCTEQEKRYDFAFQAVDVPAACECDILITTTPSRQPVVRAEWVRPGTHINAIGADAEGKQELQSALLQKGRVVVDLEEQAFHSGEVNVPLSKGDLRPDQIVGNLGDVLTGKKKGRLSPQDITIFDSTGLAVQDVALGALVYHKAKEQNRGTSLDFI